MNTLSRLVILVTLWSSFLAPVDFAGKNFPSDQFKSFTSCDVSTEAIIRQSVVETNDTTLTLVEVEDDAPDRWVSVGVDKQVLLFSIHSFCNSYVSTNSCPPYLSIDFLTIRCLRI